MLGGCLRVASDRFANHHVERQVLHRVFPVSKLAVRVLNEDLDLDPGLVKVRVCLDLAQNLDKLIESCFDEFWSVSLLARQSFDINAIVGKYAEIVLLTLAHSDIAIILVDLVPAKGGCVERFLFRSWLVPSDPDIS